MATTLLLLFKIFLFSWFFTSNDYIQENLLKMNTDKLYKRVIFDVLSCIKCLSFWSTIIITQNFFLACIVAIVSEIYQNGKK